MSSSLSAGYRLEQYTLKRPQEVLIIQAKIDGDIDQVMIFKGFSSSLMHPTAFDPDIPVLPKNATILSIDRLQGPYTPNTPNYLAQGLTWESFQPLLQQAGV